jgi:hypothetical protein
MPLVTLQLGQAVPWRPSPTGFAQVDSFGRRTVRLVYRTHRGRFRFARVPVRELRGGNCSLRCTTPSIAALSIAPKPSRFPSNDQS